MAEGEQKGFGAAASGFFGTIVWGFAVGVGFKIAWSIIGAIFSWLGAHT